jgi:hypothetical protein
MQSMDTVSFRALLGGLLVAASIALSAPAAAQCILANPSFEITGSGGAVFGGWNQFGSVGQTTIASHGARAARVSGPNQGGWDVSAYWQRLDCQPGEQWSVTGHVYHPDSKSLTGQCSALVNIEWRNADGQLIAYDSFSVADPGTPTDTYIPFNVQSAPAPVGTVAIHALFGVLQAPGTPSPDVFFDQATVYSTSTPTIDDQQWDDFPGGVSLPFAGRTWRVKGPGYYGPGPNVFCEGPQCVWVDSQGRLHLTLSRQGSTWRSTEVVLEDALGYGDYIVTTEGRLDAIDAQAVLGIFLWQYGPCWDEAFFWWNPYNEIDIEYSRWGNPGLGIGQFVAQPYDHPGNMARFDAVFADDEITSHAMRWLPDRVEYRVWRGGVSDESPETMIYAWNYSGPHVPRPEQPRMHLNLWKLSGTPAADQTVVFTDFNFVPAEGTVSVDEPPAEGIGLRAPGRLHPVFPNPTNPRTTISFSLDQAGQATLVIHDLAGRRVRTLLDGRMAAGEHRAVWDGRTDRGNPAASGVYLVVLRGSGFVETRRLVLAR